MGNILLDACLGVFGSLLRAQMNFAVPVLRAEDTVNSYQTITVERESLSHAMVVQTQFSLLNTNVSEALLIVLGVTSLEQVLAKLDRWQPEG